MQSLQSSQSQWYLVFHGVDYNQICKRKEEELNPNRDKNLKRRERIWEEWGLKQNSEDDPQEKEMKRYIDDISKDKRSPYLL